MPSTEYINERRAMTREQLAGRGIANKAVLRAFMNVPRHRFVPPKNQPNAYEDRPLNIGCGQTISQPYMVALMTDILSPMPSHNVLEVGAGSGYQAAILAELAHEVVTIERCPALAAQAERRLAALGYGNVRVLLGDGTAGAPGYGPFDRIVVTAGGPAVPDALKRQLRPGGRLVCPAGCRQAQRLMVIDRRGADFEEHEGVSCVFVPLIGREGWPAESAN